MAHLLKKSQRFIIFSTRDIYEIRNVAQLMVHPVYTTIKKTEIQSMSKDFNVESPND